MPIQPAPGRKVVLVLPAYNEALNLPKLFERVHCALAPASFTYSVLVVDDGSADNTQEVLGEYKQRIPLLTFRHERNMGLGPTIGDCLREASRIVSDDDIVVSMDADQSHNPGLIPRMAQMIGEGHDVVIASRFQPQARVCGVAAHRRFISWAAAILFRVVFPIPGVRDYTCGFRAYRGAVLKQAFATYGDHFVDQRGFQCMADILLKLRRIPIIFGEVPMILRYDLKEGASKMKIASTTFATLKLLLLRRMGR